MHPLGTYLAITTAQREHDMVAREAHPAAFARVDATPMVEVRDRSRIERMAEIVRRRVLRTAGA